MINMKLWIKSALVRALKTAAQTAVGAIGSASIFSDVNFYMVISASLLAALVSLLTSLAGIPEVNDGKPPLSEGK